MPQAQLTLEWLLTDEQAFGLTTATNVQRAVCRAADGLGLDDLAKDPAVVRVFGGQEAIEALEILREPPKEVRLLAGIRGAKSLMCACIGLKAALTCDLSVTRPDEPVQVPLLSIKKEKAAIVYKHLLTALRSRPALQELLAREPTAEVVSILRPTDGRIIDVLITAGARAGGAAISYWCACVVFDEAPRMLGEDEGVINFDETRAAALGRILPGGQIWAVGSPWAPRGPIYESVMKRHGKPDAEMLVIRATGPDMNPGWWTPARCESIRRSNPQSYMTDVMCEFADPATSLLTDAQVRRAMRDTLDATPDDEYTYGAAIDPATRSNAWTFVIVGCKRVPSERKAVYETEAAKVIAKARGADDTLEDCRFVVAIARQWQGSPAEPLKGKVLFPQIAVYLKQFGIRQVATDQWGFDAWHEIAEESGVELVLDPATTADKVASFIKLQARICNEPEPLVELPGFVGDDEGVTEYVRRDLVAIRKVPTPQGLKIDLPLTPDGRHCDFAPAIRLGIDVAEQPSWMHAMGKMEERGGLLFRGPNPGDFVSQIHYCPECQKNYLKPCPKHGSSLTSV